MACLHKFEPINNLVADLTNNIQREVELLIKKGSKVHSANIHLRTLKANRLTLQVLSPLIRINLKPSERV